MAKKKRKVILITILTASSVIISILIITLTQSSKLPKEATEVIEKINRESKNDTEFLKEIRLDIQERYSGERGCFIKYPIRNFIISGKSIWSLQGECLPCHIYNKLLQEYLSERFEKEQITTKFTFCGVTPHFYSEVEIEKDNIISMDVWGADFGVPFNKTVHDTNVCD